MIITRNITLLSLFFLWTLNSYCKNDSLGIIYYSDNKSTDKILEKRAGFLITESESAIKSLKSTLNFYLRTKNNRKAAHIQKELATVYISIGNNNKALELLLKALSNTDDKMLSAKINNNLGLVYQRLEKYEESLWCFKKSINQYSELNDSISVANAKINRGVTYSKQGLFDEALLNYLQAVSVLEKSTDTLGLANCYVNIGTIYDEVDGYLKAIEYSEKAIRLFQAIGNKNSIVNAEITIGSAYTALENYEKAIQIYQNIIRRKSEINDTQIIIATLMNLGNIYFDLNKPDTAFHYFNIAQIVSDSINDLSSIVVAKENIGIYYRKTGDLKKAEKVLLEGLEIAKNIGSSHIRIEILFELSELYASKEDYKRSKDYYKQHIAIRDSIFDKEKHRELSVLQAHYETEKKEKQIVILERNVLENKNQRLIIGCILILVLIITLFVISRLIVKRKRDSEFFRIKEKLLSSELENTKNQFKNSVSNLLTKNSLIENLEESLKKMTVSKSISEAQFKELNQLLKLKILTEDDWEIFKRHFDEVYPNYIKNLREIYPSLTVAEQRLFVLLKLKHTKIEISNILGISPESVRKTRQRLRKKLEMNQTEDLEDFIDNVLK